MKPAQPAAAALTLPRQGGRAIAGSQKLHLVGCAWFWAWAVVGGAVAFSLVSFLGVLTLVPAVLVGFIVSRRYPVNWFGVVSGIGVPLLVIAYLQRQGPGTTCTRTATGVSCDQHLNPVPWLVVGLLFLAAGVVGHAWRRERA
jgi:hypothetical protein